VDDPVTGPFLAYGVVPADVDVRFQRIGGGRIRGLALEQRQPLDPLVELLLEVAVQKKASCRSFAGARRVVSEPVTAAKGSIQNV